MSEPRTEAGRWLLDPSLRVHLSTGDYIDAGAVEAAIPAIEAEAERHDGPAWWPASAADPPGILADGTVCACLDETGERYVKTYERCERCGQFMAADPPGIDVDTLAGAMFMVRTSSNVPLPDDYWQRQSDAMRAPYIAEATRILARIMSERDR